MTVGERHRRHVAAWKKVRAGTDARLAEYAAALAVELEEMGGHGKLLGRLRKAQAIYERGWDGTLAQRNWAAFVVYDAEALTGDSFGCWARANPPS